MFKFLVSEAHSAHCSVFTSRIWHFSGLFSTRSSTRKKKPTQTGSNVPMKDPRNKDMKKGNFLFLRWLSLFFQLHELSFECVFVTLCVHVSSSHSSFWAILSWVPLLITVHKRNEFGRFRLYMNSAVALNSWSHAFKPKFRQKWNVTSSVLAEGDQNERI